MEALGFTTEVQSSSIRGRFDQAHGAPTTQCHRQVSMSHAWEPSREDPEQAGALPAADFDRRIGKASIHAAAVGNSDPCQPVA